MTTTVLGIETSCDDTSICLLRGGDGALPKILAFKSFSAEMMLEKWGGVVPEIAARNHLMKLAPLLQNCFEEANIEIADLDLIGVTTHPGLLGPLLTGLNGAKTIAMLAKKPILPVNHLYAHLEAIHLSKEIAYPYLGVVVSGGHSLYLLVKSPFEFELLGTTIDDAAGEAFDKGGKLLGLGYPAGRVIDDTAKKGTIATNMFPIGLKDRKDASLSFSGVKTALRLFMENRTSELSQEELQNVCASYQYAIVEALNLKLKYALKSGKEKSGKQTLPIVVGGGVACNSFLRKVLTENYQDVHFVEPRFCTDNGAMIANYALRAKEEAFPYPECLKIDARSRYISRGDILKQEKDRARVAKEKHREASRKGNE